MYCDLSFLEPSPYTYSARDLKEYPNVFTPAACKELDSKHRIYEKEMSPKLIDCTKKMVIIGLIIMIIGFIIAAILTYSVTILIPRS